MHAHTWPWLTPEAAAVTLGEFHHVALSIKGNGTAKVYLDGELVTVEESMPNEAPVPPSG